jgi:hypothetical protein
MKGTWQVTGYGGGGGGGGLVLLVTGAAILLGSGAAAEVATALVEVVIALAVVVALAIVGLVALLVYRARQVRPHFTYRAEPVTGIRTGVRDLPAEVGVIRQGALSSDNERPALEANTHNVRLHPEQLAELAELIRRGETS